MLGKWNRFFFCCVFLEGDRQSSRSGIAIGRLGCFHPTYEFMSFDAGTDPTTAVADACTAMDQANGK